MQRREESDVWVMVGKLEDKTFVVMDAFALPVEGTETRVTALDEGYEYMVHYQTTCERTGRVEPVREAGS